MRSPVFTFLLVVVCCFCTIACISAAQDLRNNATDFTVAANLNANNTPAWNNNEDFDFASRGLIATYDPLIIPADIPNITAWNAEAFRLFKNGSRSDTINPLLYRQAQLNNLHGLFMVSPGIYQVRGFDMSSMTLIKGDTGWIV
ncbi:MAG: MBL fold metallo-hydrolase, partial [Methanoregula sp.]